MGRSVGSLALAVLLSLCAATCAQAAYALGNHRSDFAGTNQDGFTSGQLDTANCTGASQAADLIVVGIAQASSGPASGDLTDSQSNAWTALTTYNGLGTRFVRLWYKQAPSTSATHTFTIAGTDTFPAMAVACFTGSTASPFDGENGAGQTFSSTIQTGSVTPTAGTDLMVTIICSDSSTSANTIDGSFTVIEDVTNTDHGHEKISLAYKIKTDSNAENPTWTRGGGSATLAATLAAFKAGTGGGGACTGPFITLMGVGKC